MINYKNGLIESFKSIYKHISAVIKWTILGIATGTICGGIGVLFLKTVSAVTNLREENSWLLFLLPIGGLISVGMYKLCRTAGLGTNQLFEAVRGEGAVSGWLAPAVFLGTTVTHLFGGSAGREGAALQLGGSVSSFLAKLLRLDDKTSHIIMMCGMGAVFTAVFGTPMGACFFVLEVISVGHFYVAAFFPQMVSCLSAYAVSRFLGAKPERFGVGAVPNMSIDVLVKAALIAVVAAAVSIVFCKSLRFSEHLFKRAFRNEFVRIFAGGVLIIILTLIVGTRDYNGGGIDVISRIFENGEVRYEAFILKVIFTAITIGAGFKGGEIIPTFFIGATLGGSLALLLGISPAFGAALGMATMFCGVTNCPIATIFISVELFGADGMLYYLIVAMIGFLLSGKESLYSSQIIDRSKLI